jgi:hypothetical protein
MENRRYHLSYYQTEKAIEFALANYGVRNGTSKKEYQAIQVQVSGRVSMPETALFALLSAGLGDPAGRNPAGQI